MTAVSVVNAQREAPVGLTAMRRLARCAAKRLRLRAREAIVVTFVSQRRIRSINRRFLGHDRPTDVLSFRYDGGARAPRPMPHAPHYPQVVGEVLVAPAVARAYAKRHGLSYRQELERYVVHGLLHWQGHEDRTDAQQRTMRRLEDRLLESCA